MVLGYNPWLAGTAPTSCHALQVQSTHSRHLEFSHWLPPTLLVIQTWNFLLQATLYFPTVKLNGEVWGDRSHSFPGWILIG